MAHDSDITRDDIVTALHVRGAYGYESPDGYQHVELQDATEALLERDDAAELLTALFESLNSGSATNPAHVDTALKEWGHEVKRLADKTLTDMDRWRDPYYRHIA